MSEQILREAENRVVIEGYLSENKLDYKTSQQGKDYISGDLYIEVSESNIVPVNFFSFAEKKDGSPNKIYKALANVIENYKSIAKVGREEADKIKITGARLEGNEFYNTAGQLIQTFRIRSNFINKVTDVFNPQAVFEVEAYLQSIADEIKDEVPTDRLLVNAVIPMYQGRISVIRFVVNDSKGVKYIKDNYTEGDTVKLAGEVNNESIAVQRVEEMEFGDDIVQTFNRIKRELVITRGTKPYEDSRAFDPATVKKAMIQREIDLKTQLEEQQQNSKQFDTAFSNDDVPF